MVGAVQPQVDQHAVLGSGHRRLQFVFVGTSPLAGVPANLNFSGYMSGAARPGLPANQTVHLTC